jgi:hypothetical protein
MRPSDVTKTLVALISTRRPMYVWVGPGVRKSSLERQAAECLSFYPVDVCSTRSTCAACRESMVNSRSGCSPPSQNACRFNG